MGSVRLSSLHFPVGCDISSPRRSMRPRAGCVNMQRRADALVESRKLPNVIYRRILRYHACAGGFFPELKMRQTLAAAAAVLALFSTFPAHGATITVFAAASLKEALDDQVKQFEAGTGNKVVVSYAASNALAKQIEAGAPADVF